LARSARLAPSARWGNRRDGGKNRLPRPRLRQVRGRRQTRGGIRQVRRRRRRRETCCLHGTLLRSVRPEVARQAARRRDGRRHRPGRLRAARIGAAYRGASRRQATDLGVEDVRRPRRGQARRIGFPAKDELTRGSSGWTGRRTGHGGLTARNRPCGTRCCTIVACRKPYSQRNPGAIRHGVHAKGPPVRYVRVGLRPGQESSVSTPEHLKQPETRQKHANDHERHGAARARQNVAPA
jgi:hypothetical protein